MSCLVQAHCPTPGAGTDWEAIFEQTLSDDSKKRVEVTMSGFNSAQL